jgi:hypothetical protein
MRIVHPFAAPEPKPVIVEEHPPDGSITEILDWVGYNKERAAAAFLVEVNRDPQRKKLLKQLKEITDG